MRILLVTNMLPFPSRDGVSVVSSHYVEGFENLGAEVDLLFLDNDFQSFDDLDCNQGHFNTIFQMKIEKVGKLSSYAFEIFGRVPYFANWKLSSSADKRLTTHYDIVWVTPRSVLKIVNEMRNSEMLSCSTVIGGVNDIVSLRYRQMAMKSGLGAKSIKSKLTSISCNLRSKLLWRSEERLLNTCDIVHVQTDAELEWLTDRKSTRLKSITVAQPNGVDDFLFELSLERPNDTILFIGALDGMYLRRLNWFIDEILPRVRDSNPEVIVQVVGRCGDEEFIKKLKKSGILYVDFVDSLGDLYASASILVAPIFKGYGLINKVVQAMAAGTIVVGDKTAYNGICGFKPGVHGFTAENADGFTAAILRTLKNPEINQQIRRDARTLVVDNFNWQRGLANILEKVSTDLLCRTKN